MPINICWTIPLHPSVNSDDPRLMLSGEQVQWIKDFHKTNKETCQSVSSEHKDIHASISKYGRGIDKVCISYLTINQYILITWCHMVCVCVCVVCVVGTVVCQLCVECFHLTNSWYCMHAIIYS